MECSAIPARIIAACFALTGFAAAIVVGLAVGNSATTILWKAIVVLFVCYVAGRLLGALAHRAVQDNIERFKQDNPMAPTSTPQSPSESMPQDEIDQMNSSQAA